MVNTFVRALSPMVSVLSLSPSPRSSPSGAGRLQPVTRIPNLDHPFPQIYNDLVVETSEAPVLPGALRYVPGVELESIGDGCLRNAWQPGLRGAA
jgi:hypothetical protein